VLLPRILLTPTPTLTPPPPPPKMVHRALLAAGPALRAHDPLVGIVHRELFPAMAAAVSCMLHAACCMHMFSGLGSRTAR
jgi:hypothetical protein